MLSLCAYFSKQEKNIKQATKIGFRDSIIQVNDALFDRTVRNLNFTHSPTLPFIHWAGEGGKA